MTDPDTHPFDDPTTLTLLEKLRIVGIAAGLLAVIVTASAVAADAATTADPSQTTTVSP